MSITRVKKIYQLIWFFHIPLKIADIEIVLEVVAMLPLPFRLAFSVDERNCQQNELSFS